MKRKEIAILSFKLLSLYAFIKAIDRSPDIFYYFFQSDIMHDYKTLLNFLMISVPILLLASCGLLLWYTAPLLADSIFKAIPEESKNGASLVNIQIVAFSTIGLFLLARALPDLVNVVLVILTSSSIQGGRSSMIHIVIVFVFKVALGLWLLFGSKKIVNFIESVRDKGV
jgi:hypothetical protein